MDAGQALKMLKARERIAGGLHFARHTAGALLGLESVSLPKTSLGDFDRDRRRTAGSIRWRSTFGVIDALLERGIPPTGTSNLGGSIVTAGGLVFIAATNDSRFRAFDKESGKELWVTRLPASGHATPDDVSRQEDG